MLKFSDLKPGDIVLANNEGQLIEGTVTDLNREDKEVCVETTVQEFWFKPDDLYPIPLTEERLLKLGFEKVENDDGSVKYKKDSFRVLTPTKGNFNDFEIWWREDRRHLRQPIAVHELQNHYYQMTKVELNPA
ncbi:hypothetical protein [Paraflavitalea pollutisoli]|uniref:hypothetical protein n=1 Tax=Paraflavitalea pollutisoli TaxID=3034143 RepID=UPI0023EAD3F2|nr:hypothetical protein [Paraflavitalea sp. H1-2-19X]